MANEFDQAGIRNRVTKEEIDNLIERVDYHLFEETTVTVCLIWLKNGAKVLGVNYGRILPEEQNWEMGKQEAYKDAYNKIWELEGYLVRHNLHKFESVKNVHEVQITSEVPEVKPKLVDTNKVVPVNTGFNQLIEYPGAGN